ncbi:MAG: serine--tRNA ligase, partial [Candidatus Paceibacterota bacterium]
MLDIKFIREQSDLIRAAAEKKRLSFNVDDLIASDTKRLELLKVVEDLRAKQNAASEGIANANAGERQALIDSMREVKDEMKVKEDELEEVMKVWRTLMLAVPNIPDMTVPEGKSDEDNVEAHVWGEIKPFPFTPLDHIELMEKNDLVDFERGTKTSGFRGYFL